MQAKTRLDDILERVRSAERELEQELDRMLDEKSRELQYSLRRGKVVFDLGIRRWQRQQRTGLWRYLRQAPVGYILSAPVIYGMIVPMVFLDMSVTLYQQICFRVYGIPRVCRADYLVIDRHQLAYLNVIERLNCIYCGYANGVVAYAREITGRTEQFWCPIKHARRTIGAHKRTDEFFDYGDADAWRQDSERVRRQ